MTMSKKSGKDQYLDAKYVVENPNKFDHRDVARAREFCNGYEAGQHETIVNALTSRKQHWMRESRRLVIEEPDSDEAEDATHMYGVYIDAVDDMKTFLKEGH